MATVEIEASVIEDVISGAYGSDIKPYWDYSGRGMYGRKCFGIVGRTSDLIDFIKVLYEYKEDNPDNAEILEFLDELSGVSTDSMAFDTIFYWPRVTVLNAPSDDEDDDWV